MIRITTQQEQDYTVVTIDGQIAAADLTEIRLVRMSLTGKVVLSLSGLTACPDEGVQTLRAWLDAGARLRDATLFLRMVLNAMPAVNERIQGN